MTFFTLSLGMIFGGFVEFFWGEETTCSPPNLGDKYQNCHQFYGHFHGKSWEKIPGLVQLLLSEVGSRCDNDGSGSTVTMMMGFFGISKNTRNSMTFVWVFKDDATLDVTSVFSYFFSRFVCQIEDGS